MFQVPATGTATVATPSACTQRADATFHLRDDEGRALEPVMGGDQQVASLPGCIWWETSPIGLS